MDLVTEGAQEAHLEEVARTQEAVAQSEQVWDEWTVTQAQLRDWQRWYEVQAPIERRELEEELWERLERADAEATEQNAAKAPPPLPPPPAPPAPAVPAAAGVLPAPITPAVLQNAPLNPGGLAA